MDQVKTKWTSWNTDYAISVCKVCLFSWLLISINLISSTKEMNPITRKTMSKLVTQPSFRAVGQTHAENPENKRHMNGSQSLLLEVFKCLPDCHTFVSYFRVSQSCHICIRCVVKKNKIVWLSIHKVHKGLWALFSLTAFWMLIGWQVNSNHMDSNNNGPPGPNICINAVNCFQSITPTWKIFLIIVKVIPYNFWKRPKQTWPIGK